MIIHSNNSVNNSSKKNNYDNQNDSNYKLLSKYK